MARIDLDAILAARSESEGEEHVLVFGGREFKLPSSIPFEFLEEMGAFAKEHSSPDPEESAGALASLGAAIRSIFGPDQWRDIKDLGISQDGVILLVGEVTQLYALGDAGEPQGSGGPSSDSGPKRKQTSKGSTESTSPEPATEQTA